MVATERFFSGMNLHVFLQATFLCGGEIALCASKRLFTTMKQHMSFQFARTVVCVVALVATVGLFSIIQTLLEMLCKYFHVYFFSRRSLERREQRDSHFSRILENFFSFSLLVLDLEPFQFHFHFSKKSEGILFFTFHFSKKVKAIRISLFFLEKKE